MHTNVRFNYFGRGFLWKKYTLNMSGTSLVWNYVNFTLLQLSRRICWLDRTYSCRMNANAIHCLWLTFNRSSLWSIFSWTWYVNYFMLFCLPIKVKVNFEELTTSHSLEPKIKFKTFRMVISVLNEPWNIYLFRNQSNKGTMLLKNLLIDIFNTISFT